MKRERDSLTAQIRKGRFAAMYARYSGPKENVYLGSGVQRRVEEMHCKQKRIEEREEQRTDGQARKFQQDLILFHY